MLRKVSTDVVKNLWSAGQARDWLLEIGVARSDIGQLFWASYGDYVAGTPAEARFIRRIKANVQTIDSSFVKFAADRFPSGEEKTAYEAAVATWNDVKSKVDILVVKLESGSLSREDAKKEISENLNNLLLLKEKYTDLSIILKGAGVAGYEEASGMAQTAEHQSIADRNIAIIGLAVGSLLALLSIFTVIAVTRQFSKALLKLDQSTNQVKNYSQAVSSGADSVAQASTEQAASLEEITASVFQVFSMSKENITSSITSCKLAEESAMKSEAGLKTVNCIAKSVKDTCDAASQTSSILKTIEEIAFQTNLLALNAAVEAARAGDAGKGFAVVAEEVRSLAQRSSNAAKESAETIKKSLSVAQEGAKITEGAYSQFKEIFEGNTKSVNMMKELKAASERQLTNLEQIKSSLEQLDKAVQINSASSEEASATGQDLFSEVKNLAEEIARTNSIVFGSKFQNILNQADEPSTEDRPESRVNSPKEKHSKGNARNSDSQLNFH